MDTHMIDFYNELEITKLKDANQKSLLLRKRQARQKIEILSELKNLGLDSTDLILIM
jgi:hypothetical protein